MWIVRHLLDIVIPALSAYMASVDTVFKWLINIHVLSKNFDIPSAQHVFLLINILFTTFVLHIKISYHQYKEKQFRKEIAGLYNVIKQFAQSNFISISRNDSFNFDLRIFVPEVSIHRSIKNIFLHEKEKWFVIRNIEPFAKKDITEHLRFKVEPKPQGLVGKAYIEKSIVYDDELSTTNSTNYALEETQLNRTSNLLWSLCVPITNEDNEVIAVIAFDSGTSPLVVHKSNG